MAKSTITKLSLDFTAEDMRIFNVLKQTMEATQGKTSNIAVIRAVIRKAHTTGLY